MLVLLVVLAACGPSLPDAESRGAVLYRQRCGGCHRLYQPGTLTAEMWDFQVERMRGEFARRGLPWLTPDEQRTLVGYLHEHAGHS